MPPLSRRTIGAALYWLVLAATLGGVMLAAGSLPWLSRAVAWRDAHIWSLLFGWFAQFGVGTAYWMLPRLDAAGKRGGELLMSAAWPLLNGSLVLLWLVPLFGSAGAALRSSAGIGIALAAGCWLGALLPRVLPWRELPRPKHGGR